jgi:cytochrome c biogenesis protein ResB
MIILKLIRSVWDFWGSVKLSIVLCFLLALDAAIAFPLIKMNLTTFIPLGEVGIYTWLTTYGLYNLDHTLWFYLLMVLLTFLAVNTFVCSTERVFKAIRQFKPGASKFQWFMKLGPHVMHYAVLVILLGYLGSYALSTNMPGRSLTPGGLSIKLPKGKGEVRLEKKDPKVYTGTRLEYFTNWYLDPGYNLVYTDPKGKESVKRLAYSKSPLFAGYRFYLNDFYPKRSTGGSMGLNYTKISIRRDPSAYIYIGGLLIFVLGLFMYLYDGTLKKLQRSARKAYGSGLESPPDSKEDGQGDEKEDGQGAGQVDLNKGEPKLPDFRDKEMRAKGNGGMTGAPSGSGSSGNSGGNGEARERASPKGKNGSAEAPPGERKF